MCRGLNSQEEIIHIDEAGNVVEEESRNWIFVWSYSDKSSFGVLERVFDAREKQAVEEVLNAGEGAMDPMCGKWEFVELKY